jgi:hypothetical protein
VDIREIWERAKLIAERCEASLRETAIKVPAVRRVARDVTHAHRLAERFRRPVDCWHDGHPVTVFPIGQTPPDA